MNDENATQDIDGKKKDCGEVIVWGKIMQGTAFTLPLSPYQSHPSRRQLTTITGCE